MAIQTATSSRAFRTLDITRDWLKSRRNQAIAALVVYAAISIGYFGLPVLAHPGRVCVCEPGPADSSIFMWSLAWWPHALLHGTNPFVSNAVFAPDHINIGGVTAVPGAALAVAPITLLFGPIASYNVVMLASTTLAAFFAFLLCRYVTGAFAAALVGGYVFGFSTYMLGQMLGHVHLVLVFPIPAAVHLTLRLIDGRISQRRFVALLALTMTALMLFSTELALTFVLLSGLAIVVAFAIAPASRHRLIAALKPILAAGAVTAVVTSVVIYYGLRDVPPMSPSVGEIYGGDVLGFLVPTNVIRLGRQYFAAVSAAFTAGDISESGIYVGLPLALIVARYTITRWRLTSTRFYTAMLAVVIVLLLGSHLHIAGHATIPLPWKQLGHSLLRDVLPVRLGLYMLLIVALITAAWLAQRRAGWLRAAKWVAAAVSVAFLLPNFGSGLWHWAPPNPAFFTTHQYRTALKRGETALVVPFGPTGLSMLWQAETGMWFRMAGGYLAPSPPPAYQRDPLLPALSGEDQPQPAVLRSFLARRRIGAIILGPGAPSSWPPVLAALGLKPIALGGITLYQTSKTFTTGSVIGSHE